MMQSLSSVRISAEYLCYPTWVTMPGGGEDNPDPATLGLPTELADRLVAWSDEFDAIFPPDDPGSAAFESAAQERDFYDRGRALAREVAAARPDLLVRYHAPGAGWEDMSPPNG